MNRSLQVYAIRRTDGLHFLIDSANTPTPDEVTECWQEEVHGQTFTIHGPFPNDDEANDAIEKYTKWINKERRKLANG